MFERMAAGLAWRPPCDLYHSALDVNVPDGHFVIEMTPVADGNRAARGVVSDGLVGSRGLDVESVRPPTGGRAPGWNAGIVVARR
jgi:hypothetical protein